MRHCGGKKKNPRGCRGAVPKPRAANGGGWSSSWCFFWGNFCVFQVHEELRGQLDGLEPQLLTDLVWSLCVLQQAKPHYLQRALAPDFCARIQGETPPHPPRAPALQIQTSRSEDSVVFHPKSALLGGAAPSNSVPASSSVAGTGQPAATASSVAHGPLVPFSRGTLGTKPCHRHPRRALGLLVLGLFPLISAFSPLPASRSVPQSPKPAGEAAAHQRHGQVGEPRVPGPVPGPKHVGNCGVSGGRRQPAAGQPAGNPNGGAGQPGQGTFRCLHHLRLADR